VRPPYPAIDESDLGLYEYVRHYQGDQFIQHDRPEHPAMRRIVHGYFTPKSMESWRPFVVDAVKELLDAAEEKGSMDVMRDLATPLPVLVIGQMMCVRAGSALCPAARREAALTIANWWTPAAIAFCCA
jgi:cytochrome P450